MKDPFSHDFYKPGLLTRAKRKISATFSKLSYQLKYRMPRLPGFYLSPKIMSKLVQTGISVVIFFLVVGIFQFEADWAKAVQREIRSTFSQEKDYSHLVKDYLTFGWWMNSYDRMVFLNQDNQEQESVPALTNYSMSPPVSGRVIKRFGMVKNEVSGEEYFHEGVDIEAPLGSPVVAVLSGTVLRVTDDPLLGRVVQIDHGEGIYSLYAYCSEILVREGQEVAQNQVIAKVGYSGKATSPMLHFELREQGQLVDPLSRIRPSSSQI